MKNIDQYNMYTTLLSIGLDPSEAIPILRDVRKWIDCNGLEWVVDRFKSLKTYYLRMLADDHSKIDGSIAIHADGTPKGSVRVLFRKYKDKPTLVLNVLNLYTSFTLKGITMRQWGKFSSSVLDPEPSEWWEQLTYSSQYRKLIRNAWTQSQYIPLSEWTNSPTKRSPIFRKKGTFCMESVVESIPSITEHLSVFYAHPGSEEWLARYPIPFRKSVGLVPTDDLKRRAEYPFKGLEPLVGKIGFIQERGCKLRVVANPFRVYQSVLSRLGTFCFRLLRELPWDCTFDQKKGLGEIQSWLRAGKTVYSVDLSDATNTFPLDVQIRLLESMSRANIVENQYYAAQREVDENVSETDSEEFYQLIDLFEHVSRCRWALPFGKGNATLTWKKGQPLGLFPSFGVFALTHGFLLNHLAESQRVSKSFFILGDDVIIKGETLYQSYRTSLKRMGCKVSESKTISSNVIAEFAGKVITQEGILPVEKWQAFSLKSPLEPIRKYKTHGLHMIPKSIREQLLAFACVPEPVGLGLNPMGESLDERIEGLTELFWNRKPKIPVPVVITDKRKLLSLYVLDPWFTGTYQDRHLVQILKYWTHGDEIDPNRIRSFRKLIEHVNVNMDNESSLIKEWRHQIAIFRQHVDLQTRTQTLKPATPWTFIRSVLKMIVNNIDT